MSLTRFLRSQLLVSLPPPTHSFANRTVLVTGSNTGLGLEAARHFTQLGASRVLLAVRSLDKGEHARQSIETSTGIKNVVKVMHLDMSSYASVLDFAEKLEKEVPRLDIAVLNAGVNRGIWEVFEDDEATLTVNVVATYLLACALVPTLRRTAKQFNTRPTLTFTGSEVHEWAQFPEKNAPDGKIFDALNKKEVKGKPVDLGNRYQLSKLLQLLCAREFSALVTDVTVNTVNPGLCYSELSRESGWGMWILLKLLARQTEAGSRNLVWAAGMGEESHGTYVSDCKVEAPSAWVRSEEGKRAGGRVWREVVEKLERAKSGITKV
ncbi:NAD(P)-binding protein [Decorospora gaudefroyi]|uniref:NAD(P)-binding protein n=1 Tax=Decorospora gaudefroyi TaxID=184978 RepID=A0A6A5K8R2_9PLEO|nr:NAD(P)-binding protein [Decorospora gaudefroyi]